jgi:predicted DNA-binding protein (MmcQ/YjbR family)
LIFNQLSFYKNSNIFTKKFPFQTFAESLYTFKSCWDLFLNLTGLFARKMDIEIMRKICTKLTAVTEDIKWGNDLVFSIGGKMFCVVGLDGSPTSASFKVREEEFAEMSQRDGFIPAPYVARYKWVRALNIQIMGKAEWEYFIAQSYELVKEQLPAKIKKEISSL